MNEIDITLFVISLLIVYLFGVFIVYQARKSEEQ